MCLLFTGFVGQSTSSRFRILWYTSINVTYGQGLCKPYWIFHMWPFYETGFSLQLETVWTDRLTARWPDCSQVKTPVNHRSWLVSDEITHTHIYIRYIHTYLYRTVWYSGLGLVHTMNRTIHFYILHFREAFIILLLQSALFVLHLFLIMHTRKRGRFSCKTLLLSLKNVRNFTKQ